MYYLCDLVKIANDIFNNTVIARLLIKGAVYGNDAIYLIKFNYKIAQLID